MNDELEKLIINHRDAIQDDEPLEGHFGRFEARLKKSSKPVLKLNVQFFLKVAAIVVFALLAVNQARIYFYPEKQETYTLGSISPEYREVEFYYTSAIQTGLKQWEDLKNDGQISETEQTMMQKEQEEFDLMYQRLQEDLKANPDDERVINAMLEYYQARMNIINLVINKLEEIKKQKYNDHEIKI